MMSVPVTTAGTTFSHGNPRRLFEGDYVPEDPGGRSYALAPDGRFLLMKEQATQGGSSERRRLAVIVNWADELRRVSQP